MSDSEAHVQARTVAGRYRLVRELGRGGMGVVWLAEDSLVDRKVAVKELRPPAMLEDEEREKYGRRALQEARSAARIHHPGAVTLYDVLPATDGDEAVYLIMELIEGPSLADVLEERGQLPDTEVARLGLQLVSVVEAAHALGIVHRDIKPANILIAPGPQAKLTDFGIAHTLGDPRMTNSGIMGTQAYLAPELFEGAPINPSADLWSLGATLFAAVEGRGPFERDTTGAVLRAILFDNLPTPRCGPALATAISGMLQRDPARRSTTRQVREILQRAADQASTQPEEPQLGTKPTTSLSSGLSKPGSAPPVSPVVPVRYPLPSAPSGPGPRHAAPEPPGAPVAPVAGQVAPPVSRPGGPVPPGPGAPVPPPLSRPAPPAPPVPLLPGAPSAAPPRPSPAAPPAAVATFSNTPGEAGRTVMIVCCFVTIPVVLASWAILPAAGYLAMVLASVAYLIIFFVIRSRWCELTLTPRGIIIRGGRSLNLDWDRITGFGPVTSGSATHLQAFTIGLGGGPPRPVRICPLEPQHFPGEAIRAAILSHRPAMHVEPLQPRYGYPPQPPMYR